MTAEANPSGSKRRVLLPILALVAIGVGLRYYFVDALTKLTGTWMGGVESPHRNVTPIDSKGPSVA